MLCNFILVAGGGDAKLVFEEFDEGGANLFLQFNDIAKAFVFWAVGIEFLEQGFRTFLAPYLAVAFDESEDRKILFLGPPIFGVRDGEFANQRAVLGADDEQINLAAIERF